MGFRGHRKTGTTGQRAVLFVRRPFGGARLPVFLPPQTPTGAICPARRDFPSRAPAKHRKKQANRRDLQKKGTCGAQRCGTGTFFCFMPMLRNPASLSSDVSPYCVTERFCRPFFRADQYEKTDDVRTKDELKNEGIREKGGEEQQYFFHKAPPFCVRCTAFPVKNQRQFRDRMSGYIPLAQRLSTIILPQTQHHLPEGQHHFRVRRMYP